MDRLILPTGSQPPIKRDQAHSPSTSTDLPPSPLSATFSPSTSPTKADIQRHILQAGSPPHPAQPSPMAVAAALSSRHRSPTCSPLLSSSPPAFKSAASLAFIPRTSRTSAGIRKPLRKCTELELSDMLDRNERILGSPLPASRSSDSNSSGSSSSPANEQKIQAQVRARERLRKETQDIRKELESRKNLREIGESLSRWKMDGSHHTDGKARQDLEEAMNRLSVQARDAGPGDTLSTSPLSRTSEMLGWTKDTLSVKRRLAEETRNQIPGSKVHQMSYEQSVALQTAALLAEMERERRADELRASAIKERSSNGLPSGSAHRQGRKAASSANLAHRRASGTKPFGPCPGFGLPRRASAAKSEPDDLIDFQDDHLSDHHEHADLTFDYDSD